MMEVILYVVYAVVALAVPIPAARASAREDRQDEVKPADVAIGLAIGILWPFAIAIAIVGGACIGVWRLANMKPLNPPPPPPEVDLDREIEQAERDAAEAEREMKEARS